MKKYRIAIMGVGIAFVSLFISNSWLSGWIASALFMTLKSIYEYEESLKSKTK